MKKKKLFSFAIAAVLGCSLFAAIPVVSQAASIGSVPMFRLYNPNSGEHFYTRDVSERDDLKTIGWTYEGEGWTAPEDSGTPVYRLYNPNAGDHHYTTDENERNSLISLGWNDEGIGWYSDDEKFIPIYREYNPNAVTGTHNYTTSKSEHDNLVSLGWKDEGIGWYGVIPAPSMHLIDDPLVTTPDSSILTPALLAKAQSNANVTAEDHPRWTGFVLGYGYEHQFGTSVKELELVSEWGFNSARLALHYLTLFDDEANTVDLSALKQLDSFVAAAIENDLHLDICLNYIPGRTVYNLVYDYDYSGDFDLFLNPKKQEQAFNVYRVITARYKEVPNFNLSLTPIWEPLNKNLSTGLPYTDYTPDDVAEFLGKAIDVIRAEDPDRLIIYEPTPSNDQDYIIEESAPTKAIADTKGNVIISYNFCQGPYVYACMTSDPGKHIDNMNNSMYVPEYPTYNYCVSSGIWVDAPVMIDGFLPAGTTVDIYLERSHGGTLNVSADGTILYSEVLPDTEYEVGGRISEYYPFAVSDKHIRVDLAKKADELKIFCTVDGGFDLCGIRLTLPEEYSVERWYNVQGYDVFSGKEEESGVVLRKTSEILLSPNSNDRGRHITINEDLTYTSEHIFAEASAKTINAWSDEIAKFDGNCVVRFERADFSGTTWDSMFRYYEDLLSSFTTHEFGWWSNDWWLMTGDRNIIANCPYTKYAGYDAFNLELLKLFQKYR